MARDFFGRIVKTDPWTGKKITKKQIKRDVLKENKARGKSGEDSARLRLGFQGYEVERSPRGKDFIARKRDLMTGRVTRTVHVEVKTGKSKLSKLQETTKKKKANYKVIREESPFY